MIDDGRTDIIILFNRRQIRNKMLSSIQCLIKRSFLLPKITLPLLGSSVNPRFLASEVLLLQ